MEKQKNIIDPLDEALRLVYINTDSQKETLDASTQLSYIIGAEYPVAISTDKAKGIINSLYEKLAVDSLGVLVSKAIEKEGIAIADIANESNLPVSSIEYIQADLIMANSIPVISFKSLLSRLKIPFDKAEKAIHKSFHILKSEVVFSPASNNSMRLAYRRRNAKASSSLNVKSHKSESQYLFQNEEALTKYLNRLGELYSHE